MRLASVFGCGSWHHQTWCAHVSLLVDIECGLQGGMLGCSLQGLEPCCTNHASMQTLACRIGKLANLEAGCFMPLAVHPSVCRQLRATEPGERLFLSVGCSHPGVHTWLGLDAACNTVLPLYAYTCQVLPSAAQCPGGRCPWEAVCTAETAEHGHSLPDSVPTPLRCIRHERLIPVVRPAPQSTATTSWPPLMHGPPPSRTCPTRRPACARCGGVFTRGCGRVLEELLCRLLRIQPMQQRTASPCPAQLLLDASSRIRAVRGSPSPRRFGFQPQRVAVWIYWHAVLLLAKGVPFFRYPPKAVTIASALQLPHDCFCCHPDCACCRAGAKA